MANWNPRTSLIASRLTTGASKILATLCPMVLCPENDRPHRTISIAEEFTLRRFPISGAPVDPRTAAGLRILGPVVKPRVHGAGLTPTSSRRPFLLRNGRQRTRTLQPAPRVRRRCAGRGRRRVRGASPSQTLAPIFVCVFRTFDFRGVESRLTDALPAAVESWASWPRVAPFRITPAPARWKVNETNFANWNSDLQRPLDVNFSRRSHSN